MRLASAFVVGAVALSACRPAARPVSMPAPVVAAQPLPADASVSGDAPAGTLQGSGRSRSEGPTAPAESTPPAIERSDAARRPDGAPAPDSIVAAPTWDIEVAAYEGHDRVEFYVRRYTGPARSWVTERLSRGTRYEGMIREKLRAAGLPEDLYYLAFVESGFDPNASSRASAVGMWQFMASTAKGMGLRVDWWVDERRDPIRSTDAAVRFLRGLNEQFGSLYLAAAAYNGGPARVSRGLTRFADEIGETEGEDRFFALSEQDFLPRETREYVPQIIAAALVGKEPARYDMSVATLPALAFDTVTVPGLTSLPAVARAAGTSTTAIRDLNPQFIRAVTPAGKKSVVRIPAGSRDAFVAAFESLDAADRQGVRTVQVTEVLSLANAAKKFRTTSAALRNFNPKMRRTKKGNVAADQTLYVPDADVAAAALTVADPSFEGRGVNSIRYHVVKSGETLGHIALRNGTTVATLMRLNHMKKATIFPGQELVVTGTPSKKKAASAKKPPAKKKAPASRRAA